MKMKSLLLTIAATLGMTALTMAQNVPSYVPTNGLVGWWPFNGNAIDESGNGVNGTNNGAVLTIDRYGINNSAYEFQGSQWIECSFNPILNVGSGSFSISCWATKAGTNQWQHLITRNEISNWPNAVGSYFLRYEGSGIAFSGSGDPNNSNGGITTSTVPNLNSWNHLLGIYNSQSGTISIFINGLLSISGPINPNAQSYNNSGGLFFGVEHPTVPLPSGPQFLTGKLDDIGIWNRALTQQEITDLYNASNCANNTAITPQTNTLNTGSMASFITNTTDPNPSYVWQSDFGQGFQNLNDIGNYSGTNTATLNIANVQLANHNQPIRVITTSGECIDTSIVAIISIVDTCINTITDTTFITVTDTLIINSTITSLSPPNNSNTIKVFPNPTNDHITIDYGNFIIMTGYQLQIENSLGQQVFQTDITQQSDYLNLSNWGGNGLYFVHIIDPQGNTIDIRKIVIQ